MFPHYKAIIIQREVGDYQLPMQCMGGSMKMIAIFGYLLLITLWITNKECWLQALVGILSDIQGKWCMCSVNSLVILNTQNLYLNNNEASKQSFHILHWQTWQYTLKLWTWIQRSSIQMYQSWLMTDKKYSKHCDHMKTTDVQMSYILFPEVILENFIFTVSRSAKIDGHIHMIQYHILQ